MQRLLSWPERLPRRLQAAAGIAVVFAAGAVAYLPSFRVPFVFDDNPSIVGEPRVHMVRLDWESLARATAGFPLHRWLANLSLALNHLAGGLNPAGYHAVNLAFHLAAALAAGLLAREVVARALPDDGPAARDRIALLTALLFALHPVQTQAVTYVVQRMTSMGGLFALLSLWLFLRARRPDAPRPIRTLAGAALAAFAALSCKENYLVVVALAALLELLLVPGLADRARRHPLVLAGVALGGAAAGVAAVSGYLPILRQGQAHFGIPIGDRLLTQGRVLWHYLSLLALPLPSRLHVDYAWAASTSPLEPWTTTPALVGIAVVVAATVALRRRFVLATLAVGWFLLALSIEQSVIPLDLVFEHRLYLPSFGWLLLVAVGLERLAARFGRVQRLAVALPIALLALGTWQRNRAWQDPVRLFADDANNAPGKSRGLEIAAAELMGSGRREQAEALLRKALELDPRNAGAMANLGVLAAARGEAEVADGWFRRAVEVEPFTPELRLFRADFLLGRGRHSDAEVEYRTLLAMVPGGRAPSTPLASIPGEVTAHLNLGQLLAATDRRTAAREHYDAALRLDPSVGLAYYGRAWLDFADRGPAAALEDARRATELEPGEARVHALLGEILAALGRAEEAREPMRRALELDPTSGGSQRGARLPGAAPATR